MRSELEANPDSEEHKLYVQSWVKGIQDTLCPTPAGPRITVERLKDWTSDTYLPQGLEGMMPKHADDIKTGLKLLAWYVSADFERRTSMDEGDATILARWAFMRGSLHVVLQGTVRTMKIRETYQDLMSSWS